MTEEKETFYYRHNIMNEAGYHRPVTIPISLTETLTLRDQFAMAALTGMLAANYSGDRVAKSAYQVADYMLAMRKAEK